MIKYYVAYKYCADVLASKDLKYPLSLADVKNLVKSYGIRLITYSEFGAKYDMLPWEVEEMLSSEFSFLVKDVLTNRAIIIYNDLRNDASVKFTLVHELAHYLMEHTEDSKENEDNANCFARNLLAPAMICKTLGLKTVDEIREYFGLTFPAARTRISLLRNDLWYCSEIIQFPVLKYCSFLNILKNTPREAFQSYVE